jgi:hypothetical protein
MRVLPLAAIVVFLTTFALRRQSVIARTGASHSVLLPIASIGTVVYLDGFKRWTQASNDVAALFLSVFLWSHLLSHASVRWRRCAVAGAVCLAVLGLSFAPGRAVGLADTIWRTPPSQTAMGPLRAPSVAEQRLYDSVLSRVRGFRAKSLFVFYYEPSLYPLTGLEAASRYRYFTPVLTNPEDFSAACEDLERTKPELIIMGSFSAGRFRRSALESCVDARYVVVDYIDAADPVLSYRFFVRRTSGAPTQPR